MVLELMKSHASVRDYTEEQLTRKEVEELVEAAQHAASSHFVQAYSVVWVTDREKREQLAELSNNRKQMLGAGAVFLICVDYNRLHHAGAMHGTEIVFDQAENLIVGTTDAGLFAQNLALAAESKGYGICYIGGVRNEIEAISELAGLPHGVFPVYGLTVGVPEKRNEVKPRLPVEAVLHENAYDEQKYKMILPEYDETVQAYYGSRGSNQKSATWTGQMAEFLSKPKRPHLREFLEKKGFLFK
ncbi:oxygen-insensitive NADPH nitroreductase [Indiicoccus explosivorum]|uniref:oxygen-insensitive NADPH nitroreductase n=1 Tax=Indiicoccus explosivorum TaxID=1917864 RepID=UPI000B445706|nr:oxygen-insensitive NADPH nitroreductase [Indiicoccus explosivorum]